MLYLLLHDLTTRFQKASDQFCWPHLCLLARQPMLSTIWGGKPWAPPAICPSGVPHLKGSLTAYATIVTYIQGHA